MQFLDETQHGGKCARRTGVANEQRATPDPPSDPIPVSKRLMKLARARVWQKELEEDLQASQNQKIRKKKKRSMSSKAIVLSWNHILASSVGVPVP